MSLHAPHSHSIRKPVVMALEPRLMFDGAAVVDAAHAAADAAAKALIPDAPAAVQVRAADPSANGGRTEVAFVDISVANYKAIEAGVRSGVEIVEIGGDAHGLAQIAQWAASHSGYDAVSIISHGTAGQVTLGADTLTTAALNDAATQAELAEIGHALKAGGDVLFYGCDVAQGQDGQDFIAGLAAATGADVAASTDATGNGGNWTLEAATGAIETASAVDATALAGYGFRLAPSIASSTTFYFYATDGSGNQLWGSDGSSDGTTQLTSQSGGFTAVGTPSSTGVTLANGHLALYLSDATHGAELWFSDGSAAGTLLPADIYSGATGSSIGANYPYVLAGNSVFFIANDGSHGKEWWVSDGTTAGTHLVADSNPGSGNMYTGFVPQSTSIGGVGLGDGQALLVPKPSSSGTFWFSDGSGLTTSPIDSAWAILGASLGNGKIVFFSSPHQLAVTDGTVAGTQIVDPTLPSASTAYKGRFGIAGLGDGRALVGLGGSDVGSLYLTDGTAAGTTLLADGPFGSMMYSNAGYFCNLAVLGGGRFVFEDGTGGLWGSDGTAAGTAPLGISVKPSTATPNVAALSDGRAVVLTSDNQAWVTDGTVAGTALLASLPGSVVLHSVNSLGEGKMVFACADAAGTGTELWVSDGSAAGTHILKDINPGTADAFTALTIAVTGDGKAVFLADDGIHGTETWVTDGTSAGTTLLKDVNAGADTGASQVFASRTQIVMDAGNGGTFTGGGGAVKIAPAAWVSDSGNTVRRYWYNPIISSSITGMSVTLAAAPDGAAESLSLVGQDPAISASYDAASRTLTLTGTADALTYQQALRLVTYNNTAAATLTGTSRSFTITATDPLVSVHVSGALSVARAAGGGTGTGGTGGTGTGGTGTGNTGGTGSGVSSNHAAPAPSTGTSTQGSSPPAAVVQTVMADPAPALQSVFQAIRAPGNTFGVNDSAGPGSATGIFAFTQGPATPTTVAAPVAVDTRTAAPTFQVAVAPKTAGAADSLVINAPMRDSTVAEGTRIVVTIPTDAFAATRLDVAVSLTATQADGGALPGWMTFNPQTGTFEGTPPPGFKGEVVVRVVARDQDGHEAVQTFKITVGEADQGQAAPTNENGRPQEQGPGDGPPQDEPPARQGDVGGHARVATAQPVGKPSLTEQLRAQSMNGRLAKHAALFEVLKTSGKAA